MSIPTPNPVKPPRPWFLRLLVGLAFCAFLLVTLAAVVLTFENWRGKHKFAAYRKELAAKGERLDWEAFQPPAVPADQNFATLPMVAGWFQPHRSNSSSAPVKITAAIPDEAHDKGSGPTRKKNDQRRLLDRWAAYYLGHAAFPQAPTGSPPAVVVATALAQFDPQIEELRRGAAARPRCQYPSDPNPMDAISPHLGIIKQVANVLQLRALASLNLNRPDAAFADLQLGWYLADTLKSESLLIPQLVRIASDNLLMAVAEEGLAKHAWSEPQLAWMMARLQRNDFLADYQQTMRGERAGSMRAVETMHLSAKDFNGEPSVAMRLLPNGFFQHNMYYMAYWFQEYGLPMVDTNEHRVFPEVGRQSMDALKQSSLIYSALARMLVPAVNQAGLHFSREQSFNDCLLLACAAERYRLARGTLPGKLADVLPQYLTALPHDVVTGAPLIYYRQENGAFQIYSCGWNKRDEGGLIAERREQGDWGVNIGMPGGGR